MHVQLRRKAATILLCINSQFGRVCPVKPSKGTPSPPGGLKVDFIKPQGPLVSSKKYLQMGVGVL